MALGVGKLSSFTTPALFAAIITSACAQIAFMADLYVGALYRPEIIRLLPLVLLSPIVAIPGIIFGVVLVWPVALACAEAVHRLAVMAPRRFRRWVWLVAGAICGMAALYGYAFLVELGRERIGPLLANGAICGIGCATLVRRFAGPDVDDTAAAPNLEQSQSGT